MTKARIEKCGKIGCAHTWPIGYFSPRGYCADCEWHENRKLMRESSKYSRSLRTIREIADAT